MQLMQAQGMQLYQTTTQNNTMTPQNGFQYLLQGYNGLNQLQAPQQSAIISQPQMQQSTQQQQQYMALYLQQQLQQQQRQMIVPQQQYQLMYQLNQQPQINTCFNTQMNQNQHLLQNQQQQTQISSMLYNLQPTFNYPMYVQPIIQQSNTNSLQYIPLNRTDSTQSTVAKPFDNLTNLSQNLTNTNTTLDQLNLIQKGSLQNLNFSKTFLNQNQNENSNSSSTVQTIIPSQDNQLQTLNSEKTINKENVQTLLKENIDLSQQYSIIQKAYQLSIQNTVDSISQTNKIAFNASNQDQNQQLSKASSSAKTISNKNPKRGFRLSNIESKTSQINQFSPSLSDSPIDAQREKLNARNPPIISKPIKKMTKDGSFTEDKNSQSNDNLNFQYIKIQKIDSINLNLDESRSKSETKVLIDNSIKYNYFRDSIIVENTNQLIQQAADHSSDQLNSNQISHAKNQNDQTNLLNLVNQKEVSNSKMDETHASVEQSVESVLKDEKEMLLTEIQQNHSSKQILNQFDANEEKETVNANENKIDIETFENIFSQYSDQNSKIQSSCSQSQYTPEKNNCESQEHTSQRTSEEKETPKKQLRRKLKVLRQRKIEKLNKKNKEIVSELVSKKITKNKENNFKCPSNIKLENVLPTKTRKQMQHNFRPSKIQHKEKNEVEEPQKVQKEIDNVDTFQEATQSIMNQFEKYNMKNLKRDENLISEFKTFMSNARKNDEYISQLLNPVECDFSDNFIEFLRGPAIKWIKKNIEQKKQGVYYQLINLLKSEDRSSSSLRPRKTRSAYQQFY